MGKKKTRGLFIVLFFVIFLVYHIAVSSFFPVDENNVLQAPDWYAVAGIAVSVGVAGGITFFVKQKADAKAKKKIKELTEQRDKLIAQAEALKYDIEQSSELLNEAKRCADKINSSITVKDFSEAYRTMMDNLFSLIRINEHKTVKFTGDFQEEIERINGNMEETINDFIDRSVSAIPAADIDWAEKTTNLIKEMKSDIVFTSFWKDSHEEKVSFLIERCVERGNPAGVLSNVDKMDGHEFEYWCASLLSKNGFYHIEVTPGSGDQGVDIVAAKDGIHYAIQCKCYSHDLGNTPVQEVYAGKEMYKCQVGVVMTNRYFTSGAKQLAEQTRVLLWDRDKIKQLIDSAV